MLRDCILCYNIFFFHLTVQCCNRRGVGIIFNRTANNGSIGLNSKAEVAAATLPLSSRTFGRTG